MSIKVETSPKRVRVVFGGAIVADSAAPLLVWEGPSYPVYYFPRAAVEGLVTTDERKHSPSRGDAIVCDVTAGSSTAPGAALLYDESPIDELRGTVRLDWDAMDEWLEEDEPVYTHARNPYHRIDILASSRHVVVTVDGVEVASSRSPHLLFETGLKTRYYLPLSDVRIEHLRPSDSVTHCPYKGAAGYWSLAVGDHVVEDAVWIYRMPLAESQKIAGMVSFYQEKVTVTVDGITV